MDFNPNVLVDWLVANQLIWWPIFVMFFSAIASVIRTRAGWLYKLVDFMAMNWGRAKDKPGEDSWSSGVGKTGGTLALLFALVLSLNLILLPGCATLDITNPSGTEEGITVNDALRTTDRELKLTAADVDDLCRSGTLKPNKCALAKQAVVAAAEAYDKLLVNQASGIPITTSAVLAVLSTLRQKFLEAQIPVTVGEVK
jgi:hypothetical protein